MILTLQKNHLQNNIAFTFLILVLEELNLKKGMCTERFSIPLQFFQMILV